MKKMRWLFWISTILLFLFEGLMPALTFNSKLAVEGIRHLGYPDYFRVMLTVFKVLGVLAIIIPQTWPRIKEWAYAGFAINLISATVSHVCVDGLDFQSFFPLVVLAVLIISYLSYHKLKQSSTVGQFRYA